MENRLGGSGQLSNEFRKYQIFGPTLFAYIYTPPNMFCIQSFRGFCSRIANIWFSRVNQQREEKTSFCIKKSEWLSVRRSAALEIMQRADLKN